MKKSIENMFRTLSPDELAAACTYERSSLRNLFAEELCRRAGLLPRYHGAYTDKKAREILDRAAKSFGIMLA